MAAILTERVRKAITAYRRVTSYERMLDGANMRLNLCVEVLTPEEITLYAQKTGATPRARLKKRRDTNETVSQDNS